QGWAGRSDATPTSTTSTSAPTAVAIALTAAVPEQKPAIMAAVTSRGQGETPRSSTPWSPAAISTTGRRGTGGGHARASAASRTPVASTRPRLPGGLTSRSWRRRAAARASPSTGTTLAARTATRSSASMPPSVQVAAATSGKSLPHGPGQIVPHLGGRAGEGDGSSGQARDRDGVAGGTRGTTPAVASHDAGLGQRLHLCLDRRLDR